MLGSLDSWAALDEFDSMDSLDGVDASHARDVLETARRRVMA